MSKPVKKGEFIECVALVGVCKKCGEAVRIIITKQEAKLIYKSFKLPENKRNAWMEKQREKLKVKGVVA
jgi:ssDNA-binding Zn-finger/Zn-ribbon topoisomerase 1